MASNPWGKFFWNDWETDPALRLCSLAAQGLWMRMLCLAAKATPIGYVQVGDHPCTDLDLSVLVGVDIATVTLYLAELEFRGVFSRTKESTIYSRRMIRDEKKSKINKKNGKVGGLASVRKQRGIFQSPKPTSETPSKPPLGPYSQKPEARKEEREIPRETEPPPPIPDSERDADPAALVVRKFLELREELWPRWPNAPTNPDSLTSQARATLAYGISPTNLFATIEIGMRQAHVEGQHATTNPFKAFRFSINDAISNQRSSTFAGAKNGTNETESENFEARVKRLKDRLGGKI